MLFTEGRFFLFLALVFCLYWWMESNRWRKVLLLVCSYVFYGAWNWKFLALIIASTAIDFFIGLQLGAGDALHPHDRKSCRHWLWISMAWNLGVLALFKYFNFFISSGVDFLGWLGLHPSVHTLKLILPVGISFFTFQSMSYSIDVYKGHLKPTRSLLDFSTFIAFFPQLFAGPIVRAVDFLPQLDAPRRLETVKGRALVVMFLIGFFKKAVVADMLAPFVDDYFKNPAAYNWLGCWTAVLFYAAQIYCDFSGYTDMAIASAGLLGYEFCQNFDHPYFSPNIAQFWRRWHMSLSSWLRDYLYIPLGGNRGSEWMTRRNLMLTMVLGGLWHGAAWTFVIWGFLHGLALIIQRETSGLFVRLGFAPARVKKGEPKPPITTGHRVGTFIGTVLTFYWVCIAWIFFRAAPSEVNKSGLSVAWETTKSFVLFRSPGKLDFGTAGLIAFAVMVLMHWLAYRPIIRGWWQRIPAWQFAMGCGVIAALILPWTAVKYQPFIYFQF